MYECQWQVSYDIGMRRALPRGSLNNGDMLCTSLAVVLEMGSGWWIDLSSDTVMVMMLFCTHHEAGGYYR